MKHARLRSFVVLLTLACGACGGNDFFSLDDDAGDARADAGDDAAGDAQREASTDDASGEDAGDVADASSERTDDASPAKDATPDGPVAVCCDLKVFDGGAFDPCSPDNRFSCDLGDAGGWTGCTTALEQGTPCQLGMRCRDTFDGIVTTCQ